MTDSVSSNAEGASPTQRKSRYRRTVDRQTYLDESAQMVGALSHDITAIMGEYNRQLVDLHERLRDAQPRSHGAVLMDLNRCGYGCLGCPHPVWVKWMDKQKNNRQSASKWIAVRLSRPGTAARSKSIPDEARELIAEAQALIERRARFIDHLKRINKAIGAARSTRPDLGFQHTGEGE